MYKKKNYLYTEKKTHIHTTCPSGCDISINKWSNFPFILLFICGHVGLGLCEGVKLALLLVFE